MVARLEAAEYVREQMQLSKVVVQKDTLCREVANMFICIWSIC